MEALDEQLTSLLAHYNKLLGRMMDITKARQTQEIIDRLLELRRALVKLSLEEGSPAYATVLAHMDEANASAAWTLTNLGNFALGLEKAHAAASALEDLLETASEAIG